MEERLNFRNDLVDLPEFKVSDIKCKIKLDQNESPFRLPKRLRHHVLNLLKEKYSENLYPQPTDFFDKKKKVAEFLNIDPRRLTITAGADQGILGIMMISKEKVKLLDPSYPIYRNDAIVLKKKIDLAKLDEEDNFKITTEKIGKGYNFVGLLSPNQPVGNLIDDEVISEACKNNDIVLMDEAYYEYSGKTYLNFQKEYKNLVILRTFSKAGSLAGLRLGYLIGDEGIISAVEKVLFTPYNISLMHFALLDNFEEIYGWGLEFGKRIRKIRDDFYNFLISSGFKAYESKGNFVLFKGRKKLYDDLLSNGIKTRYMNIHNKDYIRITIGRKDKMEVVKKQLTI
jgi:histidinol-phosphate aminotransferase